jgi:hypothetical protein
LSYLGLSRRKARVSKMQKVQARKKSAWL